MSSPPMQEERATSSSPGRLEWTREEEKTFETALADIMPWTSEQDSSSPEDNRFEKVAQKVGTKTIEEVKRHYDTLVDDIRAIEAGRIPIPCYVGENNQGKEKEKGVDRCVGRSGPSKIDPERRKGTPWTEEEHKLFLVGLSKFGKGDWRSISRNYVISRTPTQVASHAQKYFIRLNSMNRDRRRSSIHDITSVNGGEAASPQAPIGSSVNHPPPHQGVYGLPVGQPLTGHMVSAVGTPVMLPPGHVPYVVPMAYPITPPPPAMHHHRYTPCQD